MKREVALFILFALCISCYHRLLQSLEVLWSDGFHCAYHQFVPQQMALLHFKKTIREFEQRYYNGTWSNGGWQGTGNHQEDLARRWVSINGARNACQLAHRDHAHAIVDLIVKRREQPFEELAHKGTYCIGKSEKQTCRTYFLTVTAIAGKGEEDYMLEWVDWHLAAGADLVMLYIDNRSTAFEKTYGRAKDLLKNHIRVGLVSLHPTGGGQGYANRDAFVKRVKDSWWLAKIDMDAFLYSPLDGSVFDFLASTTCTSDIYPQQYLIPRFDVGDNAHIMRPGDFMANAYTRSTVVPEIYQPMLYMPAGESVNVNDGSPHNFASSSTSDAYRNCEGIFRCGPFLVCWTRRHWLRVYYIGWPGHGLQRISLVSASRDEEHITLPASVEVLGRFSGIALAMAFSCSLCLICCAKHLGKASKYDITELRDEPSRYSMFSWQIPNGRAALVIAICVCTCVLQIFVSACSN